MDGYLLPQEAVIEGKHYKINGDFRNILAIFSFLEDPDLPEFIRWQAALNRFYTEPLAEEHLSQGAEYFSWFVRMGQKDFTFHVPVTLADGSAAISENALRQLLTQWGLLDQ